MLLFVYKLIYRPVFSLIPLVHASSCPVSDIELRIVMVRDQSQLFGDGHFIHEICTPRIDGAGLHFSKYSIIFLTWQSHVLLASGKDILIMHMIVVVVVVQDHACCSCPRMPEVVPTPLGFRLKFDPKHIRYDMYKASLSIISTHVPAYFSSRWLSIRNVPLRHLCSCWRPSSGLASPYLTMYHHDLARGSTSVSSLRSLQTLRI